MKSSKEKIALVIAILIIVGIISAVVTGVIFIKNHIFINKNFITARQFVEIMEEEEFDTDKIDTSELDDKFDIKEAYRAENKKYGFDFYTFNSVSDAKEFYNYYQNEFDSNMSSKRFNISGNNYSTFTIVSDGKYKLVERIDKTVLVVEAKSSNEEHIKKVLDILGY